MVVVVVFCGGGSVGDVGVVVVTWCGNGFCGDVVG